jgi:hypothetical protein
VNSVGSYTGSAVIRDPTAADFPLFPAQVPDGENALQLSGSDRQIASTHLLVPGSYTLSVWIGDRQTVAFPGYRIQLLAFPTTGAPVVLAENSGTTAENGNWTERTVGYLAKSGDAHLGKRLGVRLINPANAAGTAVLFDRVAVSTSVPEPVSMSLLGAGLAALAIIRRRKSA